jgi:hypothetical protein
MPTAYVIELNDEAIGIVVRRKGKAKDLCGYRFYASFPRFRPIEGRIFSVPAHAQKAARALERSRCLSPKSIPGRN